MGTQLPSPKRGRSPLILGPCRFWPNGWKDQDGTWYGGRHRPTDVVLDGDPVPPKRCTAPVFGACLLWPNGCIDEDSTWYGSRPQPEPHCVRREPSSSPPRKGHSSPPLFLAHDYCGHDRPSQLLLSSCCTAYGRKCLYFTMDAPVHQNCPFPWGSGSPM